VVLCCVLFLVAFITIFKAGIFFIGGNVGGGCVIAKVKDANEPNGYRWSAPLGVLCGGLGGGFVFGGERIDCVIILNTKGAIRGFMGDKQVKFGGSMSLAAGPVGREAAANVGLSDTKEFVPAYSYSIAKGLYIGVTLEGAVLKVEDKDNQKFYGRMDITPEMILTGQVPAPLSCSPLYDALDQCKVEGTVSQRENLANSGRDLLKSGYGNGNAQNDGGLPPGWKTLYTPEGKPYYLNEATNTTQWEKPAPPVQPKPPPPAPQPLPPRPSGLPPGWKTLYTAEGKPYYFNEAANTTQWDKPSY